MVRHSLFDKLRLVEVCYCFLVCDLDTQHVRFGTMCSSFELVTPGKQDSSGHCACMLRQRYMLMQCCVLQHQAILNFAGAFAPSGGTQVSHILNRCTILCSLFFVGDGAQYAAKLQALTQAVVAAAASVDADSLALPMMGVVRDTWWDCLSAQALIAGVIDAASAYTGTQLKVSTVLHSWLHVAVMMHSPVMCTYSLLRCVVIVGTLCRDCAIMLCR